jgi:hypothetical protein
MKRPLLHTALNIFTLCVMTLTSTGFTSLVTYCSMTQSSECCCGEESHHTSDAAPAEVTLSDPLASCLTQRIAGGLNEITATVHAEVIPHPVVLDVIPVETSAVSQSINDRGLSFTLANDAAPPGVAIYIRVNSFLI